MRKISTFDDFDVVNEELSRKDLMTLLLSLSFMKPSLANTIASEIESLPSNKKLSVIKELPSARNLTDVKSILYGSEDTLNVKREHIHPFPGYKPLNFDQRKAWNQYLIYLDNLGLAGSPELDVKTRGIEEFKKYLEERPENPLNEFVDKTHLVKCIQYEMMLLRKGDSGFPGLSDEDLIIFQKWLEISRPAYMKLIPSEIDGKPGQLTTKLWYPAKSSSFSLKNDNFDYASQIEDIALTIITKYGIRKIENLDLTKKISAKNKVFLAGF